MGETDELKGFEGSVISNFALASASTSVRNVTKRQFLNTPTWFRELPFLHHEKENVPLSPIMFSIPSILMFPVHMLCEASKALGKIPRCVATIGSRGRANRRKIAALIAERGALLQELGDCTYEEGERRGQEEARKLEKDGLVRRLNVGDTGRSCLMAKLKDSRAREKKAMGLLRGVNDGLATVARGQQNLELELQQIENPYLDYFRQNNSRLRTELKDLKPNLRKALFAGKLMGKEIVDVIMKYENFMRASDMQEWTSCFITDGAAESSPENAEVVGEMEYRLE